MTKLLTDQFSLPRLSLLICIERSLSNFDCKQRIVRGSGGFKGVGKEGEEKQEGGDRRQKKIHEEGEIQVVEKVAATDFR